MDRVEMEVAYREELEARRLDPRLLQILTNNRELSLWDDRQLEASIDRLRSIRVVGQDANRVASRNDPQGIDTQCSINNQ